MSGSYLMLAVIISKALFKNRPTIKKMHLRLAIERDSPIFHGSNMAESKKHNYDESKVKTLSSIEHIRLRTGMYIGRIGDGSHQDDGCYILLKEIIDNGVDEYIMGYGREVEIKVES